MPENFPYGYHWELAPEPEEVAVIARIGDMYFEQRLSQYEIVRRLNQEGVTCRGRPWQQGTISRIIKREFPVEQRKQREHVLREATWRQRARARKQARTNG